MKNTVKKLKKLAPSKENALKLLAAVGAVGLGAAIYSKRDKVKQVVTKLIEKVKRAA